MNSAAKQRIKDAKAKESETTYTGPYAMLTQQECKALLKLEVVAHGDGQPWTGLRRKLQATQTLSSQLMRTPHE